VNIVVLTTEMTLASARDSIRLLSWLKTNASHAVPIVVANRVQSGTAEISRSDFEASIERKIDFTVPFDQKGAATAAKLGQPFIEANSQSKGAAAIKSLGERIISGVDQQPDDDADVSKKSLLGSFDLKSLLAKKPKPVSPVAATAD
jgi:pilus assembly protein CpaE